MKVLFHLFLLLELSLSKLCIAEVETNVIESENIASHSSVIEIKEGLIGEEKCKFNIATLEDFFLVEIFLNHTKTSTAHNKTIASSCCVKLAVKPRGDIKVGSYKFSPGYLLKGNEKHYVSPVRISITEKAESNSEIVFFHKVDNHNVIIGDEILYSIVLEHDMGMEGGRIEDVSLGDFVKQIKTTSRKEIRGSRVIQYFESKLRPKNTGKFTIPARVFRYENKRNIKKTKINQAISICSDNVFHGLDLFGKANELTYVTEPLEIQVSVK